MLTSIGLIGATGLTGCTQTLLHEDSDVTVINNNSENKISFEVSEENESAILQKEYELKPNESISSSYTGHASAINVTINNETADVKSFSPPSTSCETEQLVIKVKDDSGIKIHSNCGDS